MPPLPGVNSNKIFTIRTVEDTFAVKEYIDSHHSKSAVVIGGGFIGVETAENLHEYGIAVIMIEQQPQLLNILDMDMVSIVHTKLKDKGFRLLLGCKVTGFKDEAGGISVFLEDGTEIKTDIVIMSVGVVPETTLAESANIKLRKRGAPFL